MRRRGGDGGRDAFAAQVEAAERHQLARAWGAAAGAWIAAARVAVDAGAVPSARAALGAAGEAFRRDDRPREAAKALRMALGYGAVGEESAGLRVRLAGVCAETGEGEEGLGQLAAAEAEAPGLRAVILDTRAGLLLAHAPKAQVRSVVAALAAEGGAAAPAAWFRQGQLARLDGDPAAARALQHRVIDALGDRPEAWAGVAAARTELAELDLDDGRPIPAMAACETARREHEAAGRPALAARAEAARARAAVAAGLAVFPGPLREALAYAEERGLPLLVVDLQLAIGTALAASDPGRAAEVLRRAVRAADAAGVRFAAGRGRLVLASLTSGAERAGWWAGARTDLADHVPLLRRLHADRPEVTLHPEAVQVSVPWRNGRGRTLELAVDPPGAAVGRGLRWRLSAAPVTEDGPFSEFPGLARTLVLLDGPRLELDVSGERIVLAARFDVARFPGDRPTRGSVPDGPVRDLNWMVARAVPHHGEVAVDGGELGPGREWVLVPLEHAVEVEGVVARPLEVLCVTPSATVRRWSGRGAVFVGWLDPLP